MKKETEVKRSLEGLCYPLEEGSQQERAGRSGRKEVERR